MHTVGYGIWQENLQMRKMRNSSGKTLHMAKKKKRWKACKMKNTHCRNLNMSRKMPKEENEKLTLLEMKYGEKHIKTWKMINTHRMTWNMERKSEKREIKKNTHSRTWILARKLTNVENEMQTLWPGICGETLKKLENEKHTVGTGIWREIWPKRKMRNSHGRSWKIWQTLKNVQNAKNTL